MLLPDPNSQAPHRKNTGFGSLAFAQFLPGYTGRSTEHRGRKVEDEPLFSLHQLQELLEQWISAVWQNRAHDSLRDPLAPGRTFSPNEKYAALVETAGFLPLALTAEDYLELLPTRWQAVNSYGIKINHRIYNCDGLNDLRREKSGIVQRKNRWEVRSGLSRRLCLGSRQHPVSRQPLPRLSTARNQRRQDRTASRRPTRTPSRGCLST